VETRKIWSRELARFPDKRSQIAHLKSILSDLGMDGRPSNEKAKKIKEERELRKEVESLGGKMVEAPSEGEDGSEEEEEEAPPIRRPTNGGALRAGGLNVSFLGDQSDDSSG